jgi:hypothetical protein
MLDDAGERSAVRRSAWKHLAGPGTRKAVSVMSKDATEPEFAVCVQFPEAVRLLWEGTQKALDEWGMDRSDVASLCDIIVRLADHRLMVIKVKGSSPGSKQVADQVRHYRELASELSRWAGAPQPEPDWVQVSEKLQSVGAARLDLPLRPEE